MAVLGSECCGIMGAQDSSFDMVLTPRPEHDCVYDEKENTSL